jgi:hypothetical protein
VRYAIKDFRIELIDEPLSRHCVAWEQATRKMKSADVKPLLNKVMAKLRQVNVTEQNLNSLISLYQIVSETLEAALSVLENNEAVTASADYAIMVKAAIEAGWIVSPELKAADVDELPQWKVNWMAHQISELYLQSVTVPKN